MITLVLGGARSGKSQVAETMAARRPPVTYVATMHPDPDDADLAERLDHHRRRRPATWRTVEPPFDLPTVLTETADTVLVDSLGPWLTALPDMVADHDALRRALTSRTDPVIVVSEEVGMGVHPPTEAGRRFCDELGRLNQTVAAVADECLLVVAGRVLRLDQP